MSDNNERGLQEVINSNDSKETTSIEPGSEVDLINSIKAELEKENSKNNSIQTDEDDNEYYDEDEDNIIDDEDEEDEETIKLKEEKKQKNKKQKQNALRIFLLILIYFAAPLIFITGIFFLFYFIDNIYIRIAGSASVAPFIGLYFFGVYRFSLRKKMNTAENVLKEISKGKLSFNIEEDISLKNNLGSLAEPIEQVMKEISDMVTKVELSGMDLAGNASALKYFAGSMAKKTDQQADSITDIDNSAKDLNDSMQDIKSHVDSAYEISKTSIQEADTSSLEILSLIEEMNTINEMSDKIITTMNFIDDIADETNLLALNASIQAAHAGDVGSGFAVVADEIRNLAESSSKATKSIYSIIEKTVESIQRGVKASEKAKKALTKIVSSIKSTEDLMSQITESISIQSKTTHTLKDSVENIQGLTKNINSDTQNMESAITNLSGQADILTNLITHFEIHASSIKSDVIFGVDGNKHSTDN